MRLARITGKTYYDARSIKFRGLGSEIWIAFPRFGKGFWRHSDFAAYLTWGDVERAIEAFRKQGHPKALALGNPQQSN